ncbi:hypothetical protein [Cyclobacterium marinum]|uniref:hypothetical protein n=1 Tax=Cyclobacterium marinum TaxID=104 RepID=UPI0011EBA84A|nr:hypothetical protein [Cyclobacterium marinum]MBI0401354.1 hypothetical protein [Cyclobacterium marinum]
MTGQCKLCEHEKELRRSHILPEFMYQNLYDASPRRFYTLNVDLDNSDESKRKIEQKGIREYLLCGNCEVQLSKYENYAAETIYAKNLGNKAIIKKANKTPDQQFFSYEYEGFSYPDFKIFLLSILWRVIVSKSFNTPEVDENIVEKIRLAVHKEDPLDFDDFGCLLQIIKYKNGKIAGGFILDPYLTKDERSPILNILIDGFMYSFYLNSKELSLDQKEFFLKKEGTMVIVVSILFTDTGLYERIKAAFDFLK